MNTFLRTFTFLVLIAGVFSLNNLQGQNLLPGSKAESIEDFETGDFSQFNWQFGGDADWTISNTSPYEGSFSARSGVISNSQISQLILSYEVYAQDTLTFWHRVSSEGNYDKLKFFIDGNLQDEWSGNLPWDKAEYIIPVGMHTFTWEYYKDFSVSSNEDAVWIDFITFPPEEIEAAFIADTTVICEEDEVQFTDLSIGPVTEWNWIFEGGYPATSTEQNPLIWYPTNGIFDVILEVSDGIETSQTFMSEYIHVGEVPQTANTPTGISYLCASWGNSTYNTTAVAGVSSYSWNLNPTEAGSVSGSGTSATVIWNSGFLGTAELTVAGINYCGVGVPSNPLLITRYLPDVQLVLPAYVGLPEPAFQLMGGTPAGGEYSGTGVSNGMFDP
ncbi:MAG: PKD domain-containing protein, partial [Bacteroidales bacterium]|nr:PKD domain-containing protein [Bacteroidales bacterium]